MTGRIESSQIFYGFEYHKKVSDEIFCMDRCTYEKDMFDIHEALRDLYHEEDQAASMYSGYSGDYSDDYDVTSRILPTLFYAIARIFFKRVGVKWYIGSHPSLRKLYCGSPR
eukprot:GHVO01010666.1.p1 GENE.GHVO01010666.1~~GHVO01010666.1.p1  ORF type:complete len:112 (-),score=12.06 GHVO01010666.1:42-377(-)